jgi:hypothetical protein
VALHGRHTAALSAIRSGIEKSGDEDFHFMDRFSLRLPFSSRKDPLGVGAIADLIGSVRLQL